MGRDVMIGVVTAVITSILTFFAASSLGLFEDAVKNLGALRVAEQIVNDDNISELFVDKLAEDQRFRGRDGRNGVDGTVIGAPRVFRLSAGSRDNPKSKEQNLGSHLFCAISEHRHPHAAQACSCALGARNGNWSLSVTVDEGVRGSCSCSAMCF